MSYAFCARLYLSISPLITYFKVSFSIPYYSNGEDERWLEAKIL